MNRYINILRQVAIAAASIVGLPACTPNKLVVDPGLATVEVQRDLAGATSVRVTPHDEPNPARPTPVTPTPPVVVTEAKPDTEAVADAQQAHRTAATQTEEVKRLTASKAVLEKELDNLTSRRDKIRTEIADGQRAADALAVEIMRLAAQKAVAEQELATATTNLANAKSALTAADTAVAASETCLAELTKNQADAEAALAAAQDKLQSVTAETTRAAANLHDFQNQVQAKRRELAALAAQASQSGGTAATQPTPAAQAGTPTHTSPGGGHGSPASDSSEAGSLPQVGSNTGAPPPDGSRDSGQTRPGPADGGTPTWRMATLGATSVLGLAAITGILIWLAARGCYTCLIHSLKTGQDVSQAIRRGRESVVITADGEATMAPVECLNPEDTYLSVSAFGRPLLWAGNGVYVNGETVPAGSSIKLQPGARISVGPDAVFEFRSCLRSDAHEESETALAA